MLIESLDSKSNYFIYYKGHNKTARLDRLQDGSVVFKEYTHETDVTSDSDVHKHFSPSELWKIQKQGPYSKILNSQSNEYLRVSEDLNGYKLDTFKQEENIDEEDEKKIIWNVRVDLTYRSFIIESIYRNKKRQTYSLFHQESFEHLLIVPEKENQSTPKQNTQEQSSQKESIFHPTLTIKGLKGKTYDKFNVQYYFRKLQYASFSYPSQDMSPMVIVYPEDVDDILAVVQFAIDEKKKVVARSGGHQYCGKSSGGQDTIVIDMNEPNFTQIKKLGDYDLVQVGPGVKLKNLSAQLVKLNYSIPHGQCPLVSLGGHAQTGGYGHLLRGFGFCGDYVQSFQIVTVNKQNKPVFNRVVRPNSKYQNVLKRSENLSQEQNNDIFTAVLTGNAGSFGIITKYTFKVIRDQDHPNTYGYKRIRKYEKKVFRSLMDQVLKWTEIIKSGDDDKEQTLRALDFMMSIGSTKVPDIVEEKYRFPVILVELVYSDLDNKPYNNQFAPIISKAEKGIDFISKQVSKFLGLSYNRKENLSAIVHSQVRSFPTVTPITGRQFDRPYKKRINVTCGALTSKFLDEFCNLVDKVLTENRVKLVFQMVFGGGAVRSKGRQLKEQGFVTYPHRQSTYGFVFDLFYDPFNDEQERAIQFQSEMNEIIAKYYNTDGQERRFFWGTFGPQEDTDMSRPQVVKMFYDDEFQYKKMQELKSKIDPNDIFHTNLTVKLPSK